MVGRSGVRFRGKTLLAGALVAGLATLWPEGGDSGGWSGPSERASRRCGWRALPPFPSLPLSSPSPSLRLGAYSTAGLVAGRWLWSWGTRRGLAEAPGATSLGAGPPVAIVGRGRCVGSAARVRSGQRATGNGRAAVVGGISSQEGPPPLLSTVSSHNFKLQMSNAGS